MEIKNRIKNIFIKSKKQKSIFDCELVIGSTQSGKTDHSYIEEFLREHNESQKKHD